MLEIVTAVPVSLHVEQHGEGPPLILGHGFAGSARNFRPQARAFRGTRRVVLFDARGHGRSDAPDDPARYHRKDFVDDLRGIVDGASRETVTLGGLSMGAAIALEYACRFPDRLNALVLAAFPRGGSEARQWALDFADAIERRGLDAAGEQFAWGSGRFDERSAALVRQGFMEHAPHALAHILRGVLAEQPSVNDLAGGLSELDVPTLVVVGEHDRPSLDASRRLAEALPQARLVIVPRAGHVVNLQNPNEFNDALLDFLSEIESPHAPMPRPQ